MDYAFDSVQQSYEMVRFFFPKRIAEMVTEKGLTLLNECTGIFIQRFNESFIEIENNKSNLY